MNAQPQRNAPTAPAAPMPEPIFVFGSGLSGQYKDGTAAVAARFYKADLSSTAGQTGDAYAIPFRDEDNQLMSARALTEHVNQFIKHARATPNQQFRVARIGCDRNGYRDCDIAPMFRSAPANCTLPALWRRELGVVDTARVLIYDPLIRLGSEQWRLLLKDYLALNMPLWGVSKCELLSVGTSRGVSAVAETAKALGFPYREITANPHYHGANADAAVELLGVWHATQMINITNPNETALPVHSRILRVALDDGVNVDDLNSDNFF